MDVGRAGRDVQGLGLGFKLPRDLRGTWFVRRF